MLTLDHSEGNPGMETASGELTDFCLVVVPDADAGETAAEAVRRRFTFLGEETRMELVSQVAERVDRIAARGSGRPITVTISLEADAIHARVSDQPETDERREARFEL